MTSPENTTAAMLQRAAAIGRANGLRYVYAGNLPGAVGDLEDTHCAGVRRRSLVARYGYHIRSYRLTPERARCPSCGAAAPGRWEFGLQGSALRRSRSFPPVPGLQSFSPDEGHS